MHDKLQFRFRYLIIVVTGLVILLLSVPAWAQGGLRHFAPIQATALPSNLGDSNTASGLRTKSQGLAELEKVAGFTLMLPSYLPANCGTIVESHYIDIGKEAIVNYPCLIMAQKIATHVDRPLVGPGSTGELTVGGEPALYTDGIWVTMQQPGQSVPSSKGATWKTGFHTLVIEQHALVIRLAAAASQLSKAELIQIAESLR